MAVNEEKAGFMVRHVFVTLFPGIFAFFALTYFGVRQTTVQKCENEIAQILSVDRKKVENKNYDERFINAGPSDTIFPISIAEGKYISHLYTHRFGGPDKPYMAVQPYGTGISI